MALWRVVLPVARRALFFSRSPIPFARDRATVGKATDTLNREMETYDRAATRAYARAALRELNARAGP